MPEHVVPGSKERWRRTRSLDKGWQQPGGGDEVQEPQEKASRDDDGVLAVDELDVEEVEHPTKKARTGSRSCEDGTEAVPGGIDGSTAEQNLEGANQQPGKEEDGDTEEP